MVLGDGIRRDIPKVSPEERDRFIKAILKLDTTKFFPDGVSYWDKQEDIHKNAHFNGVDVHSGPAFISWHRVIVNRLEQLLREVDPALSLHYWDWTTDPRSTSGGRAALFADEFMDNSNGEVSHLLKDFESTESGHTKIWRSVGNTAANPDGTPAISSDATILANSNFQSFGSALKSAHDSVAHSYIGGTISDPHYSFHDPFVFLLHSNLDRLWAKWQTEPGHAERMSPTSAYSGLTPPQLTALATEKVEPWAGGTGLDPWASDPTKRAVINYMDKTIVTPFCYDTNGSNFQIVESENPFNTSTSRYQIEFNDVPEEETTWRAAVLKVYTCGDFTLRIKPGTEPNTPFSVVTPSVFTKHKPEPFVEVRLWFQFTAGPVGSAPQIISPVNTTIVCDENGQEFNFELIANTIKRPTVAVQLALDQSGSMADPAGTSGATRLQVLKDAASLFSMLIQKNNGIGIIRFDHNAYPPNDPVYGGLSITKILGDGFGDMTRIAALNAISAHGAHGNTSVGDGLEMARNQLNALPINSYDQKAIIILTDGIENASKYIADVSGLIDNRTFAIGLGNENQVNTNALSILTSGTNGLLLLTGLLSSSIDDQFRLRKFFLQILAGITRNDIVKDPLGYINVDDQVKIPFELGEADINCRVILLSDFPIIKLSLETPSGEIIDESNGMQFSVTFDKQNNVRVATFNLPLAFQQNKIHSGTWIALLEVDKELYKRLISSIPNETFNINSKVIEDLKSKGAKYCLSVHSFSNLRMSASISQNGFGAGSELFLRTTLKEYGLPVAYRAKVSAELELPDKSNMIIPLIESEPGIFTNSIFATIAGIYRFRVIAEGGTYRGTPFTREQLLNGFVFNGDGRPLPIDPNKGSDLCSLLKCIVSDRYVQSFLEQHKMDPIGILKCVEQNCHT